MYHNYRINANLLYENNLFREVEIESYVSGKKKIVKTKANIETFCLYDFLFFFTNSNNRKTIKQGSYEYTWVNYNYIIDVNPCLFLNNAKIKRQLEILKQLDLIDIINDRGSIYIALINVELSMISKTNHNHYPVMNHNHYPVMNHNYNNNKYINNNKNLDNSNFLKKEKKIKKRKNVFFVCETFSKIFNSNLFKKVETKKDDWLLANSKKLPTKETKIKSESLFSDLDNDLTLVNASKIDLKEKKDKSLIESNKNDLNANYDVLKNISSKEKKTKKANLKDEALALYHNLEFKYLKFDDWVDWVDYKLEKESKITIHTFKRNIKFLFENDINASKIIDVSISSNWSGLFALKEIKNKNIIDYDMMFKNDDEEYIPFDEDKDELPF